MAEQKHDKNTVFVRGVSFDVGDQEFNDFFSDLGPVRQAFLVKGRGGATKHKGFGFVHFALQEDAERAAQTLNGKELGGRRIQVEVALKRAPLEERKKKRKQAGTAAEGGEGGTAAPEAAAEEGAPEKQQQQKSKKPRPAKPTAPAPAAVEAGQQQQQPQQQHAKQPRQQGPSEEKHRMVRAVAVGRLTPETLGAAIKLAQAAGEVEEVLSPVPPQLLDHYKLERDGCSGQAFVAVYKSVKQATAAVAKLHGQAVAAGSGRCGGAGQQQKGKTKGKQGAAGAAQQAGEAGGVVLWARQVSGEGLHLKRWRLIVRNLPFKVTEANLRAAFAPAGFLWELTLPRSAEGKPRGFAFVGYTCRAHAEAGIRLVNGQQVAGRPVAVDWAVSKSQFDAAAKGHGDAAEAPAKGAKAGAGLDELLESDSELDEAPKGRAAGKRKLGHESEDEEGAGAMAPEREREMLASVIDDILGGGKPSKAAAAGEEGEGEEGLAREEEGGSESGSELEEGFESEESEEEEDEGAGGGDMFGKKALKERGAAQRAALERLDRKLQAKPLGKATAAAGEGAGAEGAGTAAAAAAAAAAGAEGEAGRPERPRREAAEGATVFIRGLALDVTKQQLLSKLQAYGKVTSCRLVVDKESGRLKGTAFADFADAASAQKAAEACAKARRKEGPGVVVAGRVVDVDVALGQDAVRSLAVQKAGERGPRDKRNLYLAKEGVIAEGTPVWEEMSQQDKNKRKRAAVEKKTKLASPNFLVSSTRLSVRNIPHTWTEKQLKELFTKAVVERASKAQPRVRQVKILVDEEGKGGAGGVPRSKGIGFVEFEDHEHALCALRQLNNNPKPWGKERRPIVEFAIENAKILKAREAKLARSKAQQGQQGQQAGGEQEAGPPAKRARTERAGGKQQQEGGGGAAAGATAPGQADGGEEGDAAAPPPQQQSKRQRRREIRQKLKAAKHQKVQEAAAAAAAREQGGGGGGAAANGALATASPASDAAHNRAKKRREQRKAKKAGVAGAGATPQPAAPKQQQQQQQPAAPKGGQQAAQQGKPSGGQQVQQQGKPKGGQQAAQQGKPSGGQQVQQQGKPKGGQTRPQQGQQGGKGRAPRGQQQQQQQQQQGQGQAARPGGANSRAGKAVQQAQREQQAQQRKRRADDALDGLVGGLTGGPKQQKAWRKGDGPDRLDKLAAEYRAKYFDVGKKPAAAGGAGSKAAPPAQSGLKRWFD